LAADGIWTKLPFKVPGQIWPQKCILEYKTPFEIDQKSKKRNHAFFLEMGGAAAGGQDTD